MFHWTEVLIPVLASGSAAAGASMYAAKMAAKRGARGTCKECWHPLNGHNPKTGKCIIGLCGCTNGKKK